MKHRIIITTVLFCLFRTGIVVNADSLKDMSKPVLNTDNSVAVESIQVGNKITLTGIAGYLNDKADTPCIWIIGEKDPEKQYVLIGISKWETNLVGHKVTIVGKAANVVVVGFGVQERMPRDENEIILMEVSLLNGRSPEPEAIDQTNDDPFAP